MSYLCMAGSSTGDNDPEPTRFTLTNDHLALLRLMYVGWQDCEYGAPEIDPKRPYGNSDVEEDITDALGWPQEADEDEMVVPTAESRQRAKALHREMQTALQVILSVGEQTAGTYERGNAWSVVWTRVD